MITTTRSEIKQFTVLLCCMAAITLALLHCKDAILHHRFVSDVKANAQLWAQHIIDQTAIADHINAPSNLSYYAHNQTKVTSSSSVVRNLLSNFVQAEEDLSKVQKISVLTPNRDVIDLCRYTGFCQHSAGSATPVLHWNTTQRMAFESTLDAGSTQMVLDSSTEYWTATIYVPLFKNGLITAVARVDTIVSEAGHVFIDSLSEVTELVAVIASILILLAGLFSWRRLRNHLEIQQEARFLAHHDPLTGLPNRASLMRKLEEVSSQAETGETAAIYLVLIDLDRFKEINDTLGHPTGDALIGAMARRLSMIVNKRGFVARLGGDEFAIVITFASPIHDVTAFGMHIVERFENPFMANGHQIVSTASVGIAHAVEGASEPDDLLRNADLALYSAKQEGRSTYRIFTPEMRRDLEERREIEKGLRQAIDKGELEVWYQSQHDLMTDKTVGYEALVRWVDPEKGPQSPAQFISIAEDTGLIAPIGTYVLHKACQDAMCLPEETTIAVNLSPAQLQRQDVIREVKSALEESGLPAERLEIEITERVFLGQTKDNLDVLRELKELGVKIALDDFGTGYSSLSYLASFQFDKVKIDRDFISQLGGCGTADAIVGSIVGLGHALDMTVIAEGVETSDHITLLKAAGCTLGQGWYYAKARSLSEITADPGYKRPVHLKAIA